MLRVGHLENMKGIQYVQVFKNHGKDAGTSLAHSHSQIMALSQVPSHVTEKIDAAKQFKKCPYCEISKIESRSSRKILETKEIIAFCPYASRFNYEAWIFPKNHKKTFAELNELELKGIAEALKKILVSLKSMNASYNFYIHFAPADKDLHFHVEITPRVSTWGGFEISTNSIINSVLPEDAAKFYRKNLK